MGYTDRIVGELENEISALRSVINDLERRIAEHQSLEQEMRQELVNERAKKDNYRWTNEELLRWGREFKERLEMIYRKWENGNLITEGPDNEGVVAVGRCVELSYEEENKILKVLEKSGSNLFDGQAE